MKSCLECHAENPKEAVTCRFCGGGSWPSPKKLVEIAEELAMAPVEVSAPRRGAGRPKKSP